MADHCLHGHWTTSRLSARAPRGRASALSGVERANQCAPGAGARNEHRRSRWDAWQLAWARCRAFRCDYVFFCLPPSFLRSGGPAVTCIRESNHHRTCSRLISRPGERGVCRVCARGRDTRAGSAPPAAAPGTHVRLLIPQKRRFFFNFNKHTHSHTASHCILHPTVLCGDSPYAIADTDEDSRKGTRPRATLDTRARGPLNGAVDGRTCGRDGSAGA